MNVFPYSEQDAVRWDQFVADAPMATFLHTRRFLSYHGDRFRDASLLLTNEEDHLIALLPAAVDPADESRVLSHPGITFGGLLHQSQTNGARTIEAFELIRAHYLEAGFSAFRYKAIPHIYQQTPSADDLYALFRMGANRYRCDLGCAIDLATRPSSSQRRRRGSKKALNAGVAINEGAVYIDDLWSVLEENLNRKYGATPVHTRDEIVRLHTLFPDNIRFIVGKHESRVIAGVVLFVSPRVTRTQYIASSEVGYTLCALDAIMEYCIKQAAERGARYFDFGASNEDEGRRLNEGLYQFKSEFGGGGVAYEAYELNLHQPPTR
jgi:hypothetical protein